MLIPTPRWTSATVAKASTLYGNYKCGPGVARQMLDELVHPVHKDRELALTRLSPPASRHMEAL